MLEKQENPDLRSYKCLIKHQILTIKKMVEIADAVGFEFSLIPVKDSKKDRISRSSSLPENPQKIKARMEVNQERNDER